MYDSNGAACKLFDFKKNELTTPVNKKGADPDWKQGLPWLTYATKPSILLKQSLKESNFDLTVGFFSDAATKRSDSLRFKLGVYKIDGTFIGF
jgi:hypothetical protein